jgi:hypothetical protein
MRKYVSLDKLSCFLDNIDKKFVTKDELSQITYKIQVVTQEEYEQLEIKDANTLYVIEV